MVNRVVLVGRLTRDPVLTKTVSDKSVVTFSIAVDNRRKNADGSPSTLFIECQAWNGLADNINKYTKKGSLVGVDGKLISNSYNGKDGVKRTSVRVLCDNVAFLSSKNSDNSNEETLLDDLSNSTSNSELEDEMPIEDDLPF